VHGVGGTVGAILTGIFATTAVNSAGKNGLLFGNPGQVVTQLIAIAIAYIIAAVGTWIILKILDALQLGCESKKKPNCKAWILTNTVKKDTTKNSESALVLLIGNAISDC